MARPSGDSADLMGSAAGRGEHADTVAADFLPEALPALDDDADVVDAEIVETPGVPSQMYGSPQLTDYDDAGVPSLDYLRDKIEGRYTAAIGSTELAEAAAAQEAAARAAAQHQAVITADQQRAAREQAAADKLAEIRRSLHPGT